jgi:hypothetical protein
MRARSPWWTVAVNGFFPMARSPSLVAAYGAGGFYTRSLRAAPGTTNFLLEVPSVESVRLVKTHAASGGHVGWEAPSRCRPGRGRTRCRSYARHGSGRTQRRLRKCRAARPTVSRVAWGRRLRGKAAPRYPKGPTSLRAAGRPVPISFPLTPWDAAVPQFASPFMPRAAPRRRTRTFFPRRRKLFGFDLTFSACFRGA